MDIRDLFPNNNNLEPGIIRNRQQIAQIKVYKGLKFGSITPTDIDFFIEYKNKGFIFAEAKFSNTEMPTGQKIALQRLCDSLNKKSVLFLLEHNSNDDIDFSLAKVREFYWKNQWFDPKVELPFKDWIESFIRVFENS